MSAYGVVPHKTKSRVLSLLIALFSLFLALQSGLTISATALASSVPSVSDPPQDISFAGVSVVRVISTYEAKPGVTIPAGEGPSFTECSGLGAIISSWTFSSPTDVNEWVLTDGNLVDATQETCGAAHSTQLTLTKIQLFFSSAYNQTILPNPVDPSKVVCKAKPCSGGPALLAFPLEETHTTPYVDLATGDLKPTAKIGLSQQNAAAGTLPASNTQDQTQRDQYPTQLKQFMAPQRLPASNAGSALEKGTPLVNRVGELTDMSLSSGVASVPDLAAWVHSQPELKLPQPVTHVNPVHDAWKNGITTYYQGKYAAANTLFQAAAKSNALFQAPQVFEQLIANRQANAGNEGNSNQPITISFLGVNFTIPNLQALAILGLGVLGVLLVLVNVLLIRARTRRRRVFEEYDAAERRAELEAQRIAAMEAAKYPHVNDLRCPNCGQPVMKGDDFCSNCRMALSPSESGYHVRLMPPDPPASTPELHCPRCGVSVRKGASYCSNCRLPLTSLSASVQPPVQSVPSAPMPVQAPPTVPFTSAQSRPTEESPLSAHSPTLPVPAWPEPDKPAVVPAFSETPDVPLKENVRPIAKSGTTTRIGQRLGNYRLKSLLGYGGFADVYLGEHVFLKTNAAIKVLHTRLTSADLARFLTEARTIAGLIHPHIVRVLEFGVEGSEPDREQSALDVEGSIPYLIMDYAPGGTLRKRYPKGTRVPPSKIVPYVKQVAEALHYAHGKKLIHRDVKPENILLGQGGEVLLSDFGIVAVAHGEHSMSTQEMAGTVPYIAPEQIKGKPRPASDQYSLAVVVYEWLSGNRPFQGDSQWEVIEQHLSALPARLRTKDSSIPRAVDDIVLKALAKDPLQRFESVKAFADALEQAW